MTQIGQENERRSFRIRPYLELPPLQQVFQRLVNPIRFDFQQFGGLPNQVLLGKAGMAFLRLLLQQIGYPGFHSLGGLLGHAQFFRQPVGGNEPDPEEVPGQIKGIFLDSGNGLSSVTLEYLGGQSGGNPMSLQKNHDLPNIFLRFPGLFKLSNPFGPDPLHQGQLSGVFIEDFQGLKTKAPDDPFSHLRSNPFDQTGTQIPFDANLRGRGQRFKALHPQLQTVFGMALIDPLNLKPFTQVDGHQIADDGHQFPLPFQFQLGDGEVALLVAVGDPFHVTFEADAVFFGGQGHDSNRHHSLFRRGGVNPLPSLGIKDSDFVLSA